MKGTTEQDSFEEPTPKEKETTAESTPSTSQASRRGGRPNNEDISPLETSAATNPLASVEKEGVNSGRKSFDFSKALESETRSRPSVVSIN